MGKCQLCGVQGHSARRCSDLQSYASQAQHPRQSFRQVYYKPSTHTAAAAPAPSNWILDSGASHHIATDLANLSMHSPYEGNDDVVIGNGNKLRITHIGTLAFSDLHSLDFSNALLVPSMSKNLLSVSQLCKSNNVVVVFSDSDFQVKDCHMGGILLRGPRVNGLYLWPANVRTTTTPSAFT